MKDMDLVVGGGMVVGGVSGVTLQIVIQVASLTVIGLNVVLALGGLYLLWLRIRKAKQELDE